MEWKIVTIWFLPWSEKNGEELESLFPIRLSRGNFTKLNIEILKESNGNGLGISVDRHSLWALKVNLEVSSKLFFCRLHDLFVLVKIFTLPFLKSAIHQNQHSIFETAFNRHLTSTFVFAKQMSVQMLFMRSKRSMIWQ